MVNTLQEIIEREKAKRRRFRKRFRAIVSGGGSSSAPLQIILAGWQSNLPGGHVTATGATLSSPADDAQAGLYQWSLNGGGPYAAGGLDPNPAQARILLPASGGGILNPQTIDANRVGAQYSFMKAAQAANPGLSFVVVPFGVGGTAILEYLASAGVTTNWPANRYTVTKTAYDTLKAAYPNSRIYAFIASILENEIQNVMGSGNVQGWLNTVVDDFRALGGAGASDAPFIFSSPLWEWIGNTPVNRAYLLEAAKFCASKPNCGLIRRQRGFQVSGDTIHMTNTGQRIHGPEMHSFRAVIIALNAAPAPIPAVTLTGEQLNIVSVGASYYDVHYRASGGGAYTKTELAPKDANKVGDTMKCIIPGQGNRDAIVIARSIGGDSAAAPSAGTAPMVSYAVPAVSPPTPVVSIDVDNATLDGSLNIISIPSNGSDVTAWVPTSAVGQGAAAVLKRQLVGGKYGLILDTTSKCLWRGSAFVFPAGDYSWIMPMLFTGNVGSGVFIGCGQSGSNNDILISMASSQNTMKWGHNTNATQRLGPSTLLSFDTSSAYYKWFAGSYNRAANTEILYIDDEVVTGITGTMVQRAAAPANTGGTRFFNNGIDTAVAGWGGSTIALPPKVYSAVLSYNEFQKIKNDYRVDHGVSFGYQPS